MAQANDSFLAAPDASGTAMATHLVNAKEHQVFMVAGEDGWIKGSKDSYVANYKLATDAASSALAFTHAANADKQYATIHHAITATKTVRIRRVEFYLAASALSVVNFELRYLNGTTLLATGNPAITPRPTDPATAAAEATCLALPTTAGTFPANVPLFSQEINLGANTALTATWPPDPLVMWPAEGDGIDDIGDLDIRAGVAEGYAVSVRAVAAVALKATVRIIFTEQ